MIALLANPDSGSGEAGEVELLLERLGHRVTRFELDRADEAVASRPRRIVVAGGDGSVGCAADAAAKAQVPLGVVAVGTANDFARALELPQDLDDAVELAGGGERTRRLDLGLAGERPFVNAASAGLSPVAARKAHGLKGALGPLAYTVGALRAGLLAKPIACRATVDGEPAFDGSAWQLTVGVTGAFGGGSEIDADPADGMLDLVVIEAGSRARLIRRAYGLRSGTAERQPGVIAHSGCAIEVRTQAAAGFNVDGELVEADRLAFSLRSRAFEVVVG